MIQEKPLEEQRWLNVEYIRKHIRDQAYARDLLEARREFLRLKRRTELAIRNVYIAAADRIAEELRALKPTVGPLTRNHLRALERSVRREAEAIEQAVARYLREGVEQAVSMAALPSDNVLLRAIQEAGVPLDVAKLQRGFGMINREAVEALWARTVGGVRVSDRIWQAAETARTGMRDVIHVGVATGRDVVQVARDLERYVRRGRQTLSADYPNMMRRMNRRIPKNLSYEALRLARTETTKAFHEGTYSRGRANPAYRGVKWSLSLAHPLPDVCDVLAAQDLYGMGPGVYPMGEEPTLPHPNCLCTVIPVVIETPQLVQDLRAWMEDPTSRPWLEDWYNSVYRGMVA